MFCAQYSAEKAAATVAEGEHIKRSTELKRDLDPEEARAIVDPAPNPMIDAVRRKALLDELGG